MGASMSYIAMPGSIPQQLLKVFDSVAKGEKPDSTAGLANYLPALKNLFKKSDASSMKLKETFRTHTEWEVAIFDRIDMSQNASEFLQIYSKNNQIVTCFVEEHVMFSSAEYWKNQERIWSITHDSELSRDHVAVTGVVPKGYQAIYDDLSQKQNNTNNCDYLFDLPVETAKLLSGFRYDDA